MSSFLLTGCYLDCILFSAKATVFCLHASICNPSISYSQYQQLTGVQASWQNKLQTLSNPGAIGMYAA